MSEARKGLAAKTTTQRVIALRAEREALGLKRREVYAHDDDWPAIKKLADRLQRKRERAPIKEAAAKVLRRKPKLSSSVRSSLKCEEHDEPHIDGWPLYSCLPPPKEPT